MLLPDEQDPVPLRAADASEEATCEEEQWGWLCRA